MHGSLPSSTCIISGVDILYLFFKQYGIKIYQKVSTYFSRCFLHAKSYKFLWKILQLILDYLKIDGLAGLVSSQWR